MQLEDYFTFEKFDTKFGPTESIRVKGTRVDIEIIIGEFNKGVSPEEIQRRYPTVTREQVYATITYYLHNQAQIDAYIKEGERITDAYYQEYLQKEPDAVTLRIRALRAQRQENNTTSR